MSRLGQLYDTLYGWLSGRHPSLRPWHFQWSALKDLYADLREVLPQLEGRVLDVGCGGKPYRSWCSAATEYMGVDLYPAPTVDLVIQPNQPWALPSASFDGVLCTQVLEHVADLDHVLAEMVRVLRPGGALVISVPFIYQTHSLPYDYRRFTAEGMRLILQRDCEICQVRREGGIGSTLALLLLTWIQDNSTRRRGARLLLALSLPAWLVFCGVVNCAGVLADAFDITGSFYSNFVIVARKR